MWKQFHSKLYTNVKKENIWRLGTDVNNWPAWNDDLDYCTMGGDFTHGNHFMLKPKGVRPVKIIITEINDDYCFTDCTTFLVAKMYDTHAMEETPDGVLLSNTLIVTGLLKWLCIKLVAQNVANTIPDEIDALVNRARNMHD